MSNSVNFYEFIGFITFNIEVHELVNVYSFLVGRILVSNIFRVRLCVDIKPKNLKNLKNLKTFLKNLRFLPALAYQQWIYLPNAVLTASKSRLGTSDEIRGLY